MRIFDHIPDPDDLRARVERGIRQPLPDPVWQYLESLGAVNDEPTPDDWPDLIDEVRKALALYNAGSGSSSPAQKRRRASISSEVEQVDPLPDRQIALSRIAARKAARRYDIRTFRDSHLADGLLARDDVPEWIQSRAAVEGPPGWWIENIPLPADVPLTPEGSVDLTKLAEMQIKLDFDDYPCAWGHLPLYYREKLGEYGHYFEKTVSVARNSSLEDLAWTSISVAKDYLWRRADATMFVLTGEVIRIPTIDIEWAHNRWRYGTSRLVYSIDPHLTPKALAQLYSVSRDLMLSGKQRPRAQSARGLALADFADEFSVIEGDSRPAWADLMREWNDRHGDRWPAADPHRFATECRAAYEVLMREDW